jgi:hypothetical protein
MNELWTTFSRTRFRRATRLPGRWEYATRIRHRSSREVRRRERRRCERDILEHVSAPRARGGYARRSGFTPINVKGLSQR